MIYITFLITGFVFVITQVLLFFFAFKYRHKKNRKAYYFPINYRLEIIWTAIPAITFIGLFILGYRASKTILSPADPEAQHIEIMGQQFSWMVRYPGEDQKLGDFDFRLVDTENNMGINFADKASLDDFIPMQMVLPVNTPVELKIRSRDVIHSVFLPHFRVKMDAVPGMPTRFKFTPTITTEEMREKLEDPDFDYELACTELCGRGHFSMKMMVKVVEQEEFANWYANQDPWLTKHPEYLAKVPKSLKQTAYAIINKDSILTSKVK
jgi:cytochrome c oxidase subunit 2